MDLERNFTIHEAKTKALISFAVKAKLLQNVGFLMMWLFIYIKVLYLYDVKVKKVWKEMASEHYIAQLKSVVNYIMLNMKTFAKHNINNAC